MSSSFTYTARNAGGRFITGSLKARSRSEALELLRMRSLTLTSMVSSASAGGTILSTLSGVSRASTRHAMFRSLATLVHAGLPLRRALAIVMEQIHGSSLREAIACLAVDIENGTPFGTALARYPQIFPRMISSMVRAGEISGTLDQVLERIANLLERSSTVRKRMISAIAYPAVVSVMAIGLVLFLVGMIVPTMRELFQGFNRPLPPMTRALIAAGDLLHDPRVWISALAGLFAIGAAFTYARRDERFSSIVDTCKQRIPLFGSLLRQTEVSVSARTLGTLLQAGVALEPALEICTEVATSHPMRANLLRIAEHARLGQPLAPAFAEGNLYDGHFLALVRAAEEAGTLGEMLLRIADYTDIDIESTLAGVSTLIEPLLILVIGSIVGLVVASILIPLYSGIGSLS